MKKHIKAIGGILLGVLLVLAGCTDILNPPESATQGSAGNVMIQIGHGEAKTARTLTPDFSTSNLTYELTFAGPAGESHGTETVALSEAKAITLAQGSWTITATAKTGQTATARGQETVTVGSGTTDVSIQLAPITGSGKGSFKYTVSFPTSVTSATLTLTPMGGTGSQSAALASGQEQTISDLNAGSYLLNIALEEGAKSAARTEAVHIYPSLITTAAYTFTGTEFSLLDLKLLGTWTSPWEIITITATGKDSDSIGSLDYNGGEYDGVIFGYAGDIVWAEAFDQSNGVIIIKYYPGRESFWYSGDDPTGDYYGIYYFDITGNGSAGTTAKIFGTSDQNNNYGPTETTTLDAAIARFTLANRDLWISGAVGDPQTKTAVPTAPAAPTVTPGNVQLSVSWTAVPGATAYEVYWHTENDSTKIPNANKQDVPSGISTTITGLTNGTPYYVWVKAKNSEGTSSFSPSVSGTPVAPTTAPAAPAAPTVTAADKQLTVTWTAVSGATAYEVYYGTSNNSASAQRFGGDVTVTSTTITGLTNGTPYYVWVKAKNSAGTSGFSPSVSGTPAAPTSTFNITIGFDSGDITIKNGDADVSSTTGFTLGKTGEARTATLSASPDYTDVKWYVNGDLQTGSTITLDAADLDIRTHSVTFTGKRKGLLYSSKPILFVVTDSYGTIRSAADFAKIGVASAYPLTGSYKLDADITLTDWNPIGGDNIPFTGSFDGQGHTITLNSFNATAVSSKTCLGLFAFVDGGSETNQAHIKNLKIISGVTVTSTMSTGQVVGMVAALVKNTVIEDITLSGTLSFESAKTLYLGGVAGDLAQGGVVKNCTNNMALDIKPGNGAATGISVSGNAYNYIAGFVGRFEGGAGIENCHNRANISAVSAVSGSQVFVGGVANSEYGFGTTYRGYIIDCSSTGNITGKAMGFWTFAGGIAASLVGDGGDMTNDRNTTRIVRCWATGTVSVAGTSSGNPYIGGIVGYNYYGALVSQCWFNGTVIADKSGDYTGGIAGYNSQTSDHNSRVEDCWSAGTVSGFANAGGIVGQNQVNTYIRRCYSTAAIIATGPGGVGTGGIAGMNATTQTDGITACVALNPSISVTGAITTANAAKSHRVTGTNSNAAALSNNKGRSDMQFNLGSESWTDDTGAALKDGEACDAKPAQALYTGIGWDFSSVWKMGTDGYPHLRWEQ